MREILGYVVLIVLFAIFAILFGFGLGVIVDAFQAFFDYGHDLIDWPE